MSLFFLLASSVVAQNTSTSLEVVSEYTTYLESATTLVEGTQSYIVTAPTTLTVTDCPCTRTHTYTTQYVTVCNASSSAVESVAASGTQVGVASNGAAMIGAGLSGMVAMLLL